MDKQSNVHALRQLVAALQPAGLTGPGNRFTFGVGRLDEILGGGLCRGALHEIMAAEQADAAAAIGFTVGLCRRALLPTRDKADIPLRGGTERQAILWIRQSHGETETGKLYPPGFCELGFPPEALIQVRLKDPKDILHAGAEAAGCKALGAVVIEPWGDPPVLDATSGRKLALAAEKSAVPVFFLRLTASRKINSAVTCWQVRSAASHPLQANAPGQAAFDITLLRHRSGRDGLHWRVEWNHEERSFKEPTLLRPVVSLPPDRSAAPSGGAPWRRAG